MTPDLNFWSFWGLSPSKSDYFWARPLKRAGAGGLVVSGAAGVFSNLAPKSRMFTLLGVTLTNPDRVPTTGRGYDEHKLECVRPKLCLAARNVPNRRFSDCTA